MHGGVYLILTRGPSQNGKRSFPSKAQIFGSFNSTFPYQLILDNLVLCMVYDLFSYTYNYRLGNSFRVDLTLNIKTLISYLLTPINLGFKGLESSNLRYFMLIVLDHDLNYTATVYPQVTPAIDLSQLASRQTWLFVYRC